MREVLTYSRRGSRFTPRQQEAWDRYADKYVIPDEAVDQPGFTLAGAFDREQPLAIEIGCGIGEATVELAASRPHLNVLGLEVWLPGVADCIGRFGERGLDNVRMCSVDAVWIMEHLVAPGELEELWTFFADPWPKKRHHKRRLVNARFAELVASRLRPGGTWRLATDWPDYAEQIAQVLADDPVLVGGVVERWAERPVTRFERKGIAAGREIVDFAVQRPAQ